MSLVSYLIERFRTTLDLTKVCSILIYSGQKEKLTRHHLEAHIQDKEDAFMKLLTIYLSEIDGRVQSMETMLKSLMMDKHDKDNRKDLIRRKWKALAKVLDRLFVIIYLMLVVLSLIILLPRPI